MAGMGRHGADESLALALSTGQTLADAARAAGVWERTARRRWADPDFRRRVADLRGQVIALADRRRSSSGRRSPSSAARRAASASLGKGKVASRRCSKKANNP